MNSQHPYHLTEEELRKEKQWIEEAKKDSLRFEVLYNLHYERIFRFVYQRVDGKEVAFDITQQVFVNALSAIGRYEHRGVPFSSWLFRIARNEMNQLFRKDSTHRTVNIESAGLRFAVDEMKVDPLEDYSLKLQEVISELEEDDLQLVEMRYFEKRPFKEIAEILDITENNAKVRMYRVLDKMKELILKK